MKELLEITKKLRDRSQRHAVSLSKDDQTRINNEILTLSEPDLDKFAHALLENCDDSYGQFYTRVSNLQFYIGFGDESAEVISRIWIHVYQCIESNEAKRDFLNQMLKDNARFFWHFIRSLSGFCSKIKLSAPFAADWFYGMAERVKNDLAGGGVYDGVESYATSFPESALEIYDIYEKQLSDITRRNLASLILGTVRCVRKDSFSKIDDVLKSNDDVNKRECYYKSVFASYRGGAIELKELSSLLDEMLNDGSEQVEGVAFWIVQKALIKGYAELGKFGIDWLEKNCSPTISANSNYSVISCTWYLCYDTKNVNSIKYTVANKIISKILPIPNEQLGTLNRFSDYVCDRAKRVEDFTKTILCFLTDGIENLFFLFENEQFEHFRNEVSKLDLTGLIKELIFSGNADKCRLGFLFLEHAKFTPYTSKTLMKVSEDALSVALTQLIRDRDLKQTIVNKVRFLEPFFRKAPKELQVEFVGEAVIQSVNYSQGCLEEIKRSGRSKLSKSIVTRAEKYFDNLDKARNSPANKFSFPGYKEACLRANNRFSAQVKKMAEEKSIFRQFANKVMLVYGREFSFSTGKSLSDAAPMAQFEHSMELPRLELVDPEGMSIRRLRAHI